MKLLNFFNYQILLVILKFIQYSPHPLTNMLNLN